MKQGTFLQKLSDSLEESNILLSSKLSDNFCKKVPCFIFLGSGNWSIYEIWALPSLSDENTGCSTL